MESVNDKILLTPKGLVATLKTHRFREGGGYVARCPALRLSAQGETEKEASEALDEALHLFLSDLAENGNLGAALTGDLGWRRLPSTPEYREAFEPLPVEMSTVKIGPLAAGV